VTTAAASPAWQALTAISMASITAGALADEGLPGTAFTVARVGISASLRAAKTAASPTSFRGWLPMRPPKALKAASAASGPTPAGSPMVMRMGRLLIPPICVV
jgi:hypothetical protein